MTNKRKTESAVQERGRNRRGDGRDPFDFSKLHPDQLLNEEQAAAFTNMSTSALRNKLQAGNPYEDPSYPRPRQQKGMAAKGAAVGWIAGELMQWNRTLPECDFSRRVLKRRAKVSAPNVCTDRVVFQPPPLTGGLV